MSRSKFTRGYRGRAQTGTFLRKNSERAFRKNSERTDANEPRARGRKAAEERARSSAGTTHRPLGLLDGLAFLSGFSERNLALIFPLKKIQETLERPFPRSFRRSFLSVKTAADDGERVFYTETE